MRWSVVVALLLVTEVVAARMYQWVDPDTGTPYLSGSPPAWYRSAGGGPRVQVFEDGKLVDDTRWRADVERQRVLREQAVAAERARQEAEAQRQVARRLEEKQEQGQETKEEQAADDLAAAQQPEVIRALADDLLERFYKAKLKAAADEDETLRATNGGGAKP
ncbi:MAG: hypothetical protein U5S82_12165 [Gammaproteobacteria bacterium]|nr:hypothetical protein [Gammaproteobacteria bacterium]